MFFILDIIVCFWSFVTCVVVLNKIIKSGEEVEKMAAAVNDADPEAENEQVGDFLLATERLHDCFFIVGNPETGSSERIGGVKSCLMNQSRVFRNMLHDSRLAEKNDIRVPDIEPSIFRLLLRHCYGGLDSCRDLTPEVAVKLCYAAEKYLISSLKKKVADRLKPECASEIFPALHCLVTYNVKDLEHYVTEMVREQTDKIFSSDGFVDIDVDSILFIVKQETLNSAEVDIWRALVKWATHKVHTVEGSSMRDWMSQLLKYLRLMTLSYQDLCTEVLPTKILTFDEFTQVCEKADTSDTICTVKDKRSMFQERWKWWETVTVTHETREKRFSQSDTSYSCVVVGDRNIMLESITCLGSTCRDFDECFGLGYNCQVDILITRITDYISSSSSEEPILIRFNGSANYFELFTIPTLVNGESVVLQANGMYKIKVSFVGEEMKLHPCWHMPTCSDGHSFSHGKFYCSYIYEEGIGWKPSHIVKFQYSYRR